MNFFVEAWVRRKYENAIAHIRRGLKSKEFAFTKKIDKSLLKDTDDLLERVERQFKIEAIMNEIMEIVHYENILSDYERYKKFVDGIRQGKLVLDCLEFAPQKKRLRG